MRQTANFNSDLNVSNSGFIFASGNANIGESQDIGADLNVIGFTTVGTGLT